MFQVLKRMGLGFGLEHGQVSAEDLAKARQMVPRALEQYVTQLAENGPAQGPGAKCAMPSVSFKGFLNQNVFCIKQFSFLTKRFLTQLF